MKWTDIQNIIKEELKEASEINTGGSSFRLRTGVNKNPTKLGVKIQFEPKSGALGPDTKAKLEVALQEKLNAGLSKYKFQVSKDTDVPRDEVIGFFIPLSQIKALILEGLGQGEASAPDAPLAPEPEGETEPEGGEEAEVDDMIQKEMISEMRIRELNDISKVVRKEDFYDFINKGNNILRSLEDSGINNGKKYLAYLVKHNIM